MDDISTYSISKLQKAFDLTTKKNDYFYVDTGREPLYTDDPFRTETYSVLLLKKGTMKLQVGLTSHIITAPAVLTIAPMVTRSFQRCDDKPEMAVLFFTESFLLETRANIFYLSNYHFFEDNEKHMLKATGNRVRQVKCGF